VKNFDGPSAGMPHRPDGRALTSRHPDDDLAARISVRQLMRINQIIGLAEAGHDMTAALRDVQMFILAVAHESGTVSFGADITAAEAWEDVARWDLVDVRGHRLRRPGEVA
jgi:hypothetical protein